MTDREETTIVSNSVTAQVGGVEVKVSVSYGSLIVDVSSPGEIDPTVFHLHPDFGTARVVFRKNGKHITWRDLHPFNSF